MGPVRAGLEAREGQGTGEGRLSWPVLLLMLAAVGSSFLLAVSLYQLLALRTEVDALRSEVQRRREEGQQAQHTGRVRPRLILQEGWRQRWKLSQFALNYY